MKLNEIFKIMEIIELLKKERFFITLDDILSEEDKEFIEKELVKNQFVKISFNFEGSDVEYKLLNAHFDDYLLIALNGESREIIHKLDLGSYLLYHVDELKSLKNFLISENYSKDIIDKLTKLIKLLEEKE